MTRARLAGAVVDTDRKPSHGSPIAFDGSKDLGMRPLSALARTQR